ncbi:CFI-box-CTERM domain-containing protein [Microbacterium sp. NPDC089695]|uniref:CFI-box-CTERM domain-containing protein n=1 Tax=Microbacterium sp. NPDC089695 TaxID=3364198 RepID=UPI003828FFA1
MRLGSCVAAADCRSSTDGDYDAPEVVVLRRWRDTKLRASALGCQMIRFYYASSPHRVSRFGSRNWFVASSRAGLDRIVVRLQRSGYSATPYDGD